MAIAAEQRLERLQPRLWKPGLLRRDRRYAAWRRSVKREGHRARWIPRCRNDQHRLLQRAGVLAGRSIMRNTNALRCITEITRDSAGSFRSWPVYSPGRPWFGSRPLGRHHNRHCRNATPQNGSPALWIRKRAERMESGSVTRSGSTRRGPISPPARLGLRKTNACCVRWNVRANSP